MRYIDESMTILEICEKYPESIEFLESKGFKNLSNETMKNMLGKLSLKNALLTKKVNVETFIEMLNEYVTQNRESTDITMKKNNIVDEEITVMGLLPCPIRIPLLEGFTKFLEENPDIKVCKVNVDEEQQLAIKYGVMSIPTLLVFKGGELVNQSVGVIPKEEVLNLIK